MLNKQLLRLIKSRIEAVSKIKVPLPKEYEVVIKYRDNKAYIIVTYHEVTLNITLRCIPKEFQSIELISFVNESRFENISSLTHMDQINISATLQHQIAHKYMCNLEKTWLDMNYGLTVSEAFTIMTQEANCTTVTDIPDVFTSDEVAEYELDFETSTVRMKLQDGSIISGSFWPKSISQVETPIADLDSDFFTLNFYKAEP